MPRGKRNEQQTPRVSAAGGDAFLAKQREDRAAKKKADAEAKNGAGHNSQVALTEEQEQALFFQHKRKIGALKERVASATADLRNALKTAKAEGFAKKDFDWAFQLDNADAEKALLDEERRRQQIARWMGHPVGTQAELDFAGGVDRATLEEKTRAAGKRHALDGGACVVPAEYAGGQTEQSWLDGWHDGDAVRQSIKDLSRAEIEAGERLLHEALPSVLGAPPPLGPDPAAAGAQPN